MTYDLRDRLQDSLGSAYAVGRELGGGGMARVFLAEDIVLHRTVVVKLLPPEAAADVSVDRFKREIGLAAAFQHPHIVPLLSAGDAGDLLYFTMPFVEGESLRVRLDREGELPVTVAVRILREVGTALAYAHERGVVHRDIKPDNVLLSAGSAMVTDFGVAKAITSSTNAEHAGLTSIGIALGTPAYMSPEQATADPAIDHRADLYAFGVLAYELLTGKPPFAGRTMAGVLAAHVSEVPESVARLRPSLPPVLSALVMRCLEKRPADRPQDALEVVRTLDDLAAPISEKTTAGFGATHAKRPRPPAWVFASVAVVAMVAALIATAVARHVGQPAVERSIAVLPFGNAAGDTSATFIADGLADEVSAALTREGIRTVPRASTSRFSSDNPDAQRIGRQLGVATLLSGRLRRRGATVHISADLVKVSDGLSLSTLSIDSDTADAIAARDAIVRAIVHELPNTGAEVAATGAHLPPPDAYTLYLQVQFWRNKATKESLNRARDLFSGAIARDSLFADAYAALASVYIMQADAYLPPRETIPAAVNAAKHAVALDDRSVFAHSILGGASSQYEWNHAAGLAEYSRAIALDSSFADAHLWRGWIYVTMGNASSGIQDIRAALALDPLNPLIGTMSVLLLAAAGQPDSAIALAERVRQLDPSYFYLESWVGDAFRAKGNLTTALAVEMEAERLAGRPTSGLVITLALLGRKDEATKRLLDMERRATGGEYIPPELIARGWMALRQPERALPLLEKGVAARSALATLDGVFSEFRTLAGNPRYQALMRQINLTPVTTAGR